MLKEGVVNAYFDWLYNKVCNGRFSNNISYRELLWFLHETEFICLIKKDRRRAADGEYLRYRFAYSSELDYNYVSECIDGTCSVLEMMVALALQCEESIMDNPQIGDRTGQWFWGMITNLGLGHMVDGRFVKGLAEEIMDTFLNRNYEPNGRGGLFTIKNCNVDLRGVEIWDQMCWYLNNMISTERR